MKLICKWLSLCLFAAMLLTAFASCAKPKPENPGSGAATNGTQSEPTREEVTTKVSALEQSGLEKKDFGGRKMKIWHGSGTVWSPYPMEVTLDEALTDIIYDGAYKRNTGLERDLNIALQFVDSGTDPNTVGDNTNTDKKALDMLWKSGDSASYDMILAGGFASATLATEGFFLDLDNCKDVKPDVTVMVDNCYGEFVETIEPSDVGADMTVGSLIKNPGGGLAPIGGYICGTKKCVDRCAYRLSAPGLGQEVGANLGLMPALYQGFFLAPTVVAGAEKGAIFAANLYEPLGFRCVPGAEESRHDIIQAVELGSEAGMVAFCKGIQAAAPVDSFATPYPSDMPGYNDKVIMAAGAFVQGSSIELSADGPIRPPYAVYFQGGLTWNHAKIGILMSLQKMADAGLVTL